MTDVLAIVTRDRTEGRHRGWQGQGSLLEWQKRTLAPRLGRVVSGREEKRLVWVAFQGDLGQGHLDQLIDRHQFPAFVPFVQAGFDASVRFPARYPARPELEGEQFFK